MKFPQFWHAIEGTLHLNLILKLMRVGQLQPPGHDCIEGAAKAGLHPLVQRRVVHNEAPGLIRAGNRIP